MTIHFVYSVPGRSTASKFRKRFLQKLQKMKVPVSLVGNRAKVHTSQWPYYAPVSITNNVYRSLSTRTRTLLYDWEERVNIKGGNRDILIGHPSPDEQGVWNSACLHGEFLVRIAFVPIHHRMAEFCYRMEKYVPLVDSILGITGPYWYNTWQDSALAHWKPKIIPIDMAIDPSYYPRIKKRFNPKGKRKFLFIGNSEPYKGVHLLSILFGLAKKQECVWVGASRKLPNLDCRPPAILSPNYMTKLADECDFFITMGVSDANPTTILESMAWGFPVCCTPESGYNNMPEIIQMSINDMTHNLEMLENLQYASEEDLIIRAEAARSLVEVRYTWDRFLKTVLDSIENTARNKGVNLW